MIRTAAESMTERRELIRICEDHGALDQAAAEIVAEALAGAQRSGRTPRFVLSGGSTPRGLYRLLAAEPWRTLVGWNNLEIFWGDERIASPESDESNYAMARECFLDNLSIPGERIHRIQGELSAEEAADRYDQELRRMLGSEPEFDLLLLGVGNDGHTASLFPQTVIERSDPRLAIATRSPRPPFDRVSLTPRAIEGATQILFLVQGRAKAPVMAGILGAAEHRDSFPAGRIRPRQGGIIWLLDRNAAERLDESRT